MSEAPRQPNNPTASAQLARVEARDFEAFKRALLGNVQLYADVAAGRTCMGSPVVAENVLAEIEHEVDMLVRAVAAGAGDPQGVNMNETDIAVIRAALLLVDDPPTPHTTHLRENAERALARIEAHRCVLPASIVQALNSGDGVYRP